MAAANSTMLSTHSRCTHAQSPHVSQQEPLWLAKIAMHAESLTQHEPPAWPPVSIAAFKLARLPAGTASCRFYNFNIAVNLMLSKV